MGTPRSKLVASSGMPVDVGRAQARRSKTTVGFMTIISRVVSFVDVRVNEVFGLQGNILCELTE